MIHPYEFHVKMHPYEIDRGKIMTTASTFGVRLRTMRMKSKLSLQELADKIGASKAHLWEMEQGKTKNPSLALLTELSRALGVPIKELVGESDTTTDSDSPKLAPLFRDLRGLSEDQLDLIKTMTDKLRELQHGDNKPDS